MKYSKMAWGLMALTAGLGLGACGGGGGGSTTTNNTTVGVITGFGSVYVNGCEYETTSTSISVDGQPATEDDLSVGDVVEVTGSSNCTTGNAISIKSSNELEGWVDSVSLDANGIGTMVVMGQTVTVNDLTTYEDETLSAIPLAGIVADNIIEVHGFTSDQGTVLATRIELKHLDVNTYLGEIELKGIVNNHNEIAGTFDIGGLSINYLSLSPGFTVTDGLFVEVKFNNSKQPIYLDLENNGKLGYHGDDAEEIEIYGMLASQLTNDQFMVGDQTIKVNTATKFGEDNQPNLQSDLGDAANVGKLFLEVEGYFENGMLVAKEVKLEDDISDNNECKGTVSNLVPVQGEMNMGSFTVLASQPSECEGQTSMSVTVNNNTIMEDDSTAHVSKFNLTYLRDGDLVEVYFDPTTGAAIKLERK